MDSFAPTTNDYGLLALPLGEAARAYAVLFANGRHAMSRSEIQGSTAEVFARLEPLSMALDRALLVANGLNWTSYFANGLLGSDVFQPVSQIAAARKCTGLRVVKSRDATILENYESQERGGDVTHHRRTIFATRDGRWTFGSSGEPYQFEDVGRYAARSIRDRFTPEHLDDLLVGLGAPLNPLPHAETHSAVLFVQDQKAPQLKRWTFEDVQHGLPWKRV